MIVIGQNRTTRRKNGAMPVARFCEEDAQEA